MSKKFFLKGLFAAVLSITIATIFGSSATYAEVAISNGLFTGEGDVRWEWKKITDPDNTAEPEQVSIMFYDKPAATTTIVVPSLSDVITAASASGALNTYYVRSADEAAQAANYTEPSQEKRTSTADVTVLDMTNTSKVQIMGVKPIINPETEVELIFGENMVIGDGEGDLKVNIRLDAVALLCTDVYHQKTGSTTKMYCLESEEHTFTDIQNNIRDWDTYSDYYKRGITPRLNDLGCFSIYDHESNVSYYENYNPDRCYVVNQPISSFRSYETVDTGAFAGYKLKLTNLENVKYLGWYAFQHTTLNEESRHITIKANQTAGEGVFAWSNVNAITIEGNEVFPAMFEGCTDLSWDNVDLGTAGTISYGAFMRSNLGSINLSDTSVKTVLGQAFFDAGLTAVNLGNVEKIGYESFAYNDLTEIYMPKSIKDINTARIFAGNNNLTKLTIAFDTMLVNTSLAFHNVIGEFGWAQANTVAHRIKELVVIAPYAEDEPVDETHVQYEESRTYQAISSGFHTEDDYNENYGRANSYKNVLAPGYFFGFPALTDITIGEGYEFIGANEFYNYGHGIYQNYYGNYTDAWVLAESRSSGQINKSYHVSLPSTLKGIGSNAFAAHMDGDFTINFPESLEYIGAKAFKADLFMRNDLDLPNLRYIGTQAFYVAGVHDVYLHDKLEYVGYAAFMNAWLLHDITFDYDVFGPNSHVFDGGYDDVMSMGTFAASMFSNPVITLDTGVAEYHGADRIVPVGIWYNRYKVGTITFTEKAVSEMRPEIRPDGYVTSDFTPFYTVAADKVDMSRTPWKSLPKKTFLAATIDEIVLPENLESIGELSFMWTRTGDLSLPDSIKVINKSAFNNFDYINSCSSTNSYSNFDECEASKDFSINILNIPTSLEYIGGAAFYGNRKLALDLDLPNVKVIGIGAFQATKVRDVAIHGNVSRIFPNAFHHVTTLRNITIDFDFARAIPTRTGGGYYQYYPLNFPYEYNYDFDVSNENNSNCNILIADKCYSDYVVSNLYSIFNQLNGFTRVEQWNSPDEYETITFTDKNVTPWSLVSMFVGFKANIIDLGDTKLDYLPYSSFANATIKDKLIMPRSMTAIPSGAFLFLKTKHIVLPESYESIGQNAFMYLDTEDTITLPEGLKIISDGAFGGNYSNSGDCNVYRDYCRVAVANIPTSVEKIGYAAFYGNEKLEGDLDLPNLQVLGGSAFMKTRISSVKLYDTLQAFNAGTFEYIPTLREIVLDLDYYGINGNMPFYSVFSSIDYWDRMSHVQPIDGSTFDKVVFTEKNVSNPIDRGGLAFFNIGEVDISEVKWTKLPDSFFYKTTVTEPVVMPSSLVEIGKEAFQWSNISVENAFSEGLETIGKSAFYGATISGDMTIPSTVTSIGWSAFNAGDADVNYGTVTIKPVLSYDSSDSQAVFQLFWNAKMDKLVIESPMLPVLAATGDNPILPHEVQYEVVTNEGAETVTVTPTLRADGEPEFHGMTMKEVEIKNLPIITANAFEECANLETVSFANHTNLSEVGKYAFNNDTKLKKFVFGDGLVGKDITLKEYAFNNTAVETIGNHSTDFDLTAANFNAVEPHVFSNMPKLVSVSIPSTFSIDASLANEELYTNGSTIPSYTFADDPELAIVEVSYQLSTIQEDAFANDNKITKLILWGNTDIEENGTNLTIPEPTNIFAYSDAPAENYANDDSRSTYDGKFYPLDEVLYLTSNKTYVILEQDEEENNIDFDKDGLILYALRRDGVILESDDWQTYTKAFTRASNPNIVFEEGKGAAGNLGTDEELMWTVYDAPKPFDIISLANQNYGETNFEFIQMPSSNNPLVAIHYPDGYTAAIRTTTLASMTKEEEEEMLRELEVPNTGAFQAIAAVAAPSVSIAAIIVLSGIYLARKRKH